MQSALSALVGSGPAILRKAAFHW